MRSCRGSQWLQSRRPYTAATARRFAALTAITKPNRKDYAIGSERPLVVLPCVSTHVRNALSCVLMLRAVVLLCCRSHPTIDYQLSAVSARGLTCASSSQPCRSAACTESGSARASAISCSIPQCSRAACGGVIHSKAWLCHGALHPLERICSLCCGCSRWRRWGEPAAHSAAGG